MRFEFEISVPLHVEGFLEPGQIFAMSGPSGIGKTRLLRALADLDTFEGRVALAGVSVFDMNPATWRTRVRFVPAEPAWWSATLADHGVDRPALGLRPDRLSAPIEELSTGERQRGALLRAVRDKPDVLLLDEPTSALDAATTEGVESWLRAQTARGCAIVMVSHDPDQIDRLADITLELEQ